MQIGTIYYIVCTRVLNVTTMRNKETREREKERDQQNEMRPRGRVRRFSPRVCRYTNQTFVSILPFHSSTFFPSSLAVYKNEMPRDGWGGGEDSNYLSGNNFIQEESKRRAGNRNVAERVGFSATGNNRQRGKRRGAA